MRGIKIMLFNVMIDKKSGIFVGKEKFWKHLFIIKTKDG